MQLGGNLLDIPGITERIIAIGTRAYQDASADAYNTVYLVTIAFSGIAIILTWWAPNTEDLMTGNVAATLAHDAEGEGNEKRANDVASSV